MLQSIPAGTHHLKLCLQFVMTANIFSTTESGTMPLMRLNVLTVSAFNLPSVPLATKIKACS